LKPIEDRQRAGAREIDRVSRSVNGFDCLLDPSAFELRCLDRERCTNYWTASTTAL